MIYNVPDNYSRFELEEKRLFETQFICAMCGDSFTDEDMSDDLDYCEACYNQLELEGDEDNEI